jgi:hypothetical protein
MYRLIALVVLAAAGALAVRVLVAAVTALTAETFPRPAVVVAMVVAVAFGAALTWWLIITSTRAWRQPSFETISRLYAVFTFMVFAVAYGSVDEALESRVGPASDFVEFFGPWLIGIASGFAVHVALRRWGYPQGMSADAPRAPV